MTDADSAPDEPLEGDSRPRPLDHAIVENEDAPDECLLFPPAPAETDLEARWLLAGGDGFVSLESMR